MSEVKKIATRDSYGNALVELGKEHENLIVLDADLAGATKTCIFQKRISGAPLGLRYRRVQHDRYCCRIIYLWESSVYQFFCNVCSRT